MDIYKYKYRKYVLKQKHLNKQVGGSYPLYIWHTRLEESSLKANVSTELRKQSIDNNRFYHTYYDHTNTLQKEGIHSAMGPDGFNMNEFVESKDDPKLDIDQYESILIYDWLQKINRNLNKYNIETIQSGISYWNSDIEFPEEPYFQQPWIEFSGDKNSIPILKRIINHPLASTYLSFTFNYESSGEKLRTSLIRPYIDSSGNKINDINDDGFWSALLTISNELSEENIHLGDFNKNDTELDRTKEWYIINESGGTHKIEDKDKFNPFFPSIPLSTLDVRYNNGIRLFMKKIVV